MLSRHLKTAVNLKKVLFKEYVLYKIDIAGSGKFCELKIKVDMEN